MKERCKTKLNLTNIVTDERLYYQCIEDDFCKYKKVFLNASIFVYCERENFVPYGECVANKHKFFDGYFHTVGSTGLCNVHYHQIKRKEKEKRDKANSE